MFHRFWSVDDSQVHTNYSGNNILFSTFDLSSILRVQVTE